MDLSSNSVLDALAESARARLTELGFEPTTPFPLRVVPLLLPASGNRVIAYGSILREVRRGRLEAAKVGRAWHTTLDAVVLWIARRTSPAREHSPTDAERRQAERAHSAAAARLGKSSSAGRRTA